MLWVALARSLADAAGPGALAGGCSSAGRRSSHRVVVQGRPLQREHACKAIREEQRRKQRSGNQAIARCSRSTNASSTLAQSGHHSPSLPQRPHPSAPSLSSRLSPPLWPGDRAGRETALPAPRLSTAPTRLCSTLVQSSRSHRVTAPASRHAFDGRTSSSGPTWRKTKTCPNWASP